MQQQQPIRPFRFTNTVALRIFVVLMLCLTLTITACGGNRVSQVFMSVPQGLPTTQATNPTGGNLILTLGHQDPPTLDPALVGDSTSAFLVSQLFSGLFRLDGNLEVQSNLVQYWNVSEDGRVYRFNLRSDARFADGSPITSKDVRYSFERATDPQLAPFLPAHTYLSDIVGVREKIAGTAREISGIAVHDAYTIDITIDAPKSYFLAKLTHPSTYIVQRSAVEQGGATWTEQPNGSGPFTIQQWQHDEQLVLQRNDNYYNQPALLRTVTFLMGAAANNPLVLYEQNKIDITSVDSYELARVQDETNPLSQQLHRVPQLSLNYIGFNVTQPPFDDVNVRKAFSLLIDREKLADVSYNESVIPADGILPPGMPGYNEDIPPITENIAKAKKLLAQSRYGGAENLPVIYAYGGGLTALLRDVAEKELGITIEVRNYQRFSDYLTAMQEGTLPLFATGWIADYPDPENFLNVLFHSHSIENHMHYANSALDTLLDIAATEQDKNKRLSLYHEAETLIMEDMPIIPMYHDVDYILVKPYVQGLTLTGMGMLDLSTVELVR